MRHGSSRRTRPSRRRALQETQLSLRYRHPDAAVQRSAEREEPATAFVGDQSAHRPRLREPRHGAAAACDAAASTTAWRPDHPHHIPRGVRGPAPQLVTVTLCGDRRGRTPMHLVAVGGRDPEVAGGAGGRGLSVRAGESAGSRAGATSRASRTSARRWRDRSSAHPGGDAVARFGPIARLGARSLPFIRRAHVRRGMVMFTEDGDYDVVESVERDPARSPGLRPQRRAHPQLHRRRPRRPITRSMASGAPTSRTSSSFATTSSTPTSSSSSRTTARRRRSSPPPTRSSPTTAGGWRRRCGPRSARATRSRSGSSPTSTRRRATSRPRSSGWSTRASAVRRSPSSTGPTRSRGCSRTCSCGRRSATRSSAARSSTSGRRSATPSRT